MLRASSLLSTFTTIQALCTPSLQPKSAWVRKCEPLSSRILLARAQATTPDSCGTSSRNLGMGSPPHSWSIPQTILDRVVEHDGGVQPMPSAVKHRNNHRNRPTDE